MESGVRVSSLVKILVCCHKPCNLPKSDLFLPVQVGKEIADSNLEMQGDNEINGKLCDNISGKNKSYCELTAMYWAWKNIRKLYPDLIYIGLCHYRRFFCLSDNSSYKYSRLADDCLLTKDRIIDILNGHDIIIGSKKHLKFSLGVDYCISHNRFDLELLKNVVKELHPDYIRAFDDVFTGNTFSPYNMFVLPIEEFELYCEWLFSILSNLENIIDISKYNDYQRRIFGYMAERLLNVYVRKNNLIPYYNSIICIDAPSDNKNMKAKNFAADLLYKINMKNLFLNV